MSLSPVAAGFARAAFAGLLSLSMAACNRSPEPGGEDAMARASSERGTDADASNTNTSAHSSKGHPTSNTGDARADRGGVRDTDGPRALTVSNPEALRGVDLRSVTRLELALHPNDTATRLAAGLPAPPEHACAGLDLWKLAERSPALTHLSISGCGDQLRAGFGPLKDRIQTLRISDLQVDPVLAGRLAEIHSLETLSLSRFTVENPTAVSLALAPASLSRIILQEAPAHALQIFRAVSRNVHTLRLEGPWVTPDTLRELSILQRVRTLTMIGTGITNAGLTHVQRLTSLTTIEFEEESINDLSPLYLRDLPLTSLACRCDRLGDTGARHLTRLSSLHQLTLESSRLSSDGVQLLAKLTSLHDLTLIVDALSDAAVTQLATLPALEKLWLEGRGPSNASFPGLAEATTLRALTLRVPELGDAVFLTLRELVRLESLDLARTSISDRGLAKLAKLPMLRVLNLRGTRVSRSGFNAVAALPALEHLDLSRTDVVDAAIRALAPLQRLRSLNLEATLVTSSILSVLEKMQALEALDTRNTALSMSDVHAQLPTLRLLSAHPDGAR